MSQPAANYRPDIDGLRALAVLGVVLFHLNPSWLGGGYVGVDVFFVISGFLITSVIDREQRAGKFSFLRFYERRIRRIWPALVVVILVSAAIAWFLLLPDDLVNFAKSIRYTVFSASNFHFYDQSDDYFQEGVSQMPLLHTWSLGVEEQFYIVFPLLIAFAHRQITSRGRQIGLFAILAAISLGLSAWMVQDNPETAFYLLPWRAWEMLGGSLLALVPLFPVSKKGDHIIGTTGLALIVGSMILYSEATLFPGLAALAPCLGAIMIIHAGRSGNGIASRILSWKPMVFIGLISYSVYLWHWPMIAFAKYGFFYDAPAPILIFGASLLLGWLSWRFVERPFRRSHFMTRRSVYLAWAASSIALLAGSAVLEENDGFELRFSDRVLHFLKSGVRPKKYMPKSLDTYDPALASVFGDTSATPTMAIWGDSHAGALLPVLDVLAIEHHKAFKAYDMPSQPPLIGVTRKKLKDRQKRDAYSTGVLAQLLADPNVKQVILHGRWSSYTRDQQLEKGPPALYQHPFDTVAEQRSYLADRLGETIGKLQASGKQIVLVYPVPEIQNSGPGYLAKLAAAGEEVPFTIPCEYFDNFNRDMIQVLDAWEGEPNVVTIRPTDVLMKDGQMRIRHNDELLYHDNDHLSPPGAMLLKDLFEPLFIEGP